MKHSALVSLALLVLTGCIYISDKATHEFDRALGQGLVDVVKSVGIVGFSTAWYYKVNNRWPDTRERLQEFITAQKAPIDLSRFSKIEFAVDDRGDLEYAFTMDYKNLKGKLHNLDIDAGHIQINGTFKMTKEDALTKDFLRLHLDQDNDR